MSKFDEIPLSVLDLAPVVEGGTIADTFRNTLEFARHAETLGLIGIGLQNTIICRASLVRRPQF